MTRPLSPFRKPRLPCPARATHLPFHAQTSLRRCPVRKTRSHRRVTLPLRRLIRRLGIRGLIRPLLIQDRHITATDKDKCKCKDKAKDVVSPSTRHLARLRLSGRALRLGDICNNPERMCSSPERRYRPNRCRPSNISSTSSSNPDSTHSQCICRCRGRDSRCTCKARCKGKVMFKGKVICRGRHLRKLEYKDRDRRKDKDIRRSHSNDSTSPSHRHPRPLMSLRSLSEANLFPLRSGRDRVQG
ncbi:hypothetical protein BJ138DRAFT_1161398 [Hygrophoropsis aurantiaca]|uniref:Uncharacterized protein n=1 Tax=Hygrophoropsis aurantiaca TaxID=72124 RepID=A0ACB8A087_9AGAM|nr:hypothetical protein BJ138DRAFT_1161398 [Hygrophoropsis aurantiaca]